MSRKCNLSIILAGMLMAGVAKADTVFQADPSHAQIGFSVTHLVISSVSGHFNDFAATLVLGEDNQLVRAEATMQVASIDTNNGKRDKHLRSEDFFAADQYPEITFKSKSVTGDAIVGDFTIRGVTKEISLPYQIKGPIKDPYGNTKLGFTASTTINRKDYGVAWNATTETGALVVSEDVKLTINMEFAAQP